jgi:hypothetical protein
VKAHIDAAQETFPDAVECIDATVPVPPNLTPISRPTPPPPGRMMRPFFKWALIVIGALMVVSVVAGVVVRQVDKAALREKGYVDTGITTTYEECIAEGGHLENGACVGAIQLLGPETAGCSKGERSCRPAAKGATSGSWVSRS